MSNNFLHPRVKANVAHWFSLRNFVVYVWLLPVLVQALSGITEMLIGTALPVTLLLYLLLVIFLFVQARTILKSITRGNVLLLLFGLVSVAATLVFYPANTPFLLAGLPPVILCIPAFLAGKLLPRVPDVLHLLCSVSRVGLLLALFAYATSLGGTRKSMPFAYAVLPLVICIIEGFFEEKKLSYLVLAGLGSILIFMLGTRGPVLFIIVFGAYKIYKFCNTLNTRVLLFGGVGLAGVVVASGVYLPVLEWVYQFLLSRGIRSEILYLFLTNNTKSMDGRAMILQKIMGEALEHPLRAHGLFGDFLVTDWAYAHNVVLELICEFGLVLGLVLVIVLAGYLVSVLYKTRRDHSMRELAVIMLVAYGLKMLLSASYINDMGFYTMLGVFSGIRHLPKQKPAACTLEEQCGLSRH